MARNKNKTIELTLNDGVEDEQNAVEVRSGQELTVAERLAEYLTQDGCECVSRIYREDRRNPSQAREFLERVDNFVEEEYLADKWGGGSYVVRYQYKGNDGVRKSTSLSFRISDMYKGANAAPPTVAAPAPKTGLLGAFLQDLTAEKVAGMVALVEGVKKIFAPSIDMTEVLKIAAAPRTPSIGEAVVLKALEGVNKPAQVATPAPSIIAQIKEVAQIKELLGTNTEDEDRGGDSMSFIAKLALNLLPEILKKNNNNYEAAAASVKDNPAVIAALRDDPELAGEFLNAVANSEKYGVEAAKKLALGFGYEFEPAPEQAAGALPVTGETSNTEAANVAKAV